LKERINYQQVQVNEMAEKMVLIEKKPDPLKEEIEKLQTSQ